MMKPTLGYPSRTEAILALRKQQRSTREISELVGIPETTVTALEHSALRKAGRRGEPVGRSILVPQDILDTLGPHAAKRGVTPNTLMRTIVERVVDEGLIDAVLDDKDELDAQ